MGLAELAQCLAPRLCRGWQAGTDGAAGGHAVPRRGTQEASRLYILNC